MGWTHEEPDDWDIDNSLMPDSGTLEWRGWSFTSMEFWVMAEDQLRSQFIRARSNIAVVDPDEWDDCDNGALAGPYNSILSSPQISISTGNTLELSLGSKWSLDQDNPLGTLEIVCTPALPPYSPILC